MFGKKLTRISSSNNNNNKHKIIIILLMVSKIGDILDSIVHMYVQINELPPDGCRVIETLLVER